MSGDRYRFGFNGKESDDEWNRDGNMYNYGFRIHDPRLGRFLSVDPLAPIYPELTPFQYASNSPIALIDIDGLEGGMATEAEANPRTTEGTPQHRHAQSQDKHDTNPPRGLGYTINERQQKRKDDGKSYWGTINATGGRQWVAGDPKPRYQQEDSYVWKKDYQWDSEQSSTNQYTMFDDPNSGLRMPQRTITIPSPPLNGVVRLDYVHARPRSYDLNTSTGFWNPPLIILVSDLMGQLQGNWGGGSGTNRGIAAGPGNMVVITPQVTRQDRFDASRGKSVDFKSRVDLEYFTVGFERQFIKTITYRKIFGIFRRVVFTKFTPSTSGNAQ